MGHTDQRDRLLVAEDNREFNNLMREFLEADGFSVTQAFDGDAALELLGENRFDLVLLDVMMPYRDGFDVCREIRAVSNIPIIFITARSEDEDKLIGYRAGADDYMTKPFSLTVLAAKARALIARSRGTSPGSSATIRHLSLLVDPHARTVSVAGEAVLLRPKEYEILMILLQNAGRIVSRDHLLSLVWGYDYEGDDHVLDRQIQTLRDHLKSAGTLISTVYGVGYRMEQNQTK